MAQLVSLALLVTALADPAPPPTSSATAIDLVSALESALTEAIARAEPSVVAIAREKSGDGKTTAIRGRNPSAPRAQRPVVDPGLMLDRNDNDLQELFASDYGSGVIVGDQGQILTAFHVVRGASRLVVKAAKDQAFEAEVLAADPRSDLAVIVPREAPGAEPPKLKPVRLGDATRLRKGTFLIALGSPFNAGRDASASASWGILANFARRLEPDHDEHGNPTRHLRNYPTLLQLDAKLNLGMSGGAVVNLRGELVGLTTAATSARGFDVHAGYATPIDALTRRIIETLKQGKEVEYGFIGISLDPGAPNRIGELKEGTPAHRAGLKKGDTLIGIGATEVSDGDTLILAVNAAPVGRPVKVRALRDGQVVETTIVLSKTPVDGEVIATNRPAPWRGLRVDFSSALRPEGEGSPNGVLILDRMAKGGVGIAEVESDSSAARAGLKAGQVILDVGGRRVHTPDEFAQAVAGRAGPVTLTVTGGFGEDTEAVTVK